MYRGVSYILYTNDLQHKFGQSATIEKFNPPPANFSQFKHCQAVSTNGFWGRPKDERFKYWGQKVKGQGHGGV